MDQGRQTYTEMVVAIIVQAAVVAVAGLVITGEYVMFPLSVCAGAGIAIGLLHHMYNTLDIVLDLDKETKEALYKAAEWFESQKEKKHISLCFWYFFYNDWFFFFDMVLFLLFLL